MKTALLLGLSFILYTTNVSAAVGWFRVVVVKDNPDHKTQVSFRMNGFQAGFSHANKDPLTWEIGKQHLARGPTTSASLDYSGVQQGCEFDFNLYFRSGDSGPFIHLGQFHAPTGAKGVTIPLGICGSHFCSSDANITRELRKNRLNEIRAGERARKETLLRKWRTARPDNRSVMDAESRRQQLDSELNSARRGLQEQQRQLKTSTEPIASIRTEPTDQSLLGITKDSALLDYAEMIDAQGTMKMMQELMPPGLLAANPYYQYLQDLTLSQGIQIQKSEYMNGLLVMVETVAELVTRLAPAVSLAVDIEEVRTGNYAIGSNAGQPMTSLDKSFAVVNLVTLGYGAKIAEAASFAKKLTAQIGSSAARQAGLMAERFLTVAERLGLKESGEISRLAIISKQILRTDVDGMAQLERLVEASLTVKPQLGNRYVRELPDLIEVSFVQAFEGAIIKGPMEPGDVIFQAQRTQQPGPGRWFGVIRPRNAQHAEELSNIFKHKNTAEKIKAYVVKERVSTYAGKVAGGDGYQIYFPEDVPLDKVIEEVTF